MEKPIWCVPGYPECIKNVKEEILALAQRQRLPYPYSFLKIQPISPFPDQFLHPNELRFLSYFEAHHVL